MKYLPPFDLIRRSFELSTVKGELRVSASYEGFLNVIRTMIAGIDVDETWYVTSYEDIGGAIRDGKIASAKEHFVADGYIAGRKPFEIKVYEKWYFQRYPDVAESVRKGVVPSAQQHFDEDGYREGRLPFGM